MRPLVDICHFNPRSPHGERRITGSASAWAQTISTHAPRTGSDVYQRNQVLRCEYFNPRSPHGERRCHCLILRFFCLFQPTLPARGATDKVDAGKGDQKISTHAPRTGSDLPWGCRTLGTAHFNPRSPHGERLLAWHGIVLLAIFQPTLPARGATHQCGFCQHIRVYFNPRSPHGERPTEMITQKAVKYFNPRSPHGERRPASRFWGWRRHFNPRSPHGERLVSHPYLRIAFPFQPTLPARGATSTSRRRSRSSRNFNPRSPHGERPPLLLAFTSSFNFNPRSPHGERQAAAQDRRKHDGFQPTLPARGATSTRPLESRRQSRFQPTLPARGATFWSRRAKSR